ncbi:prepilin peptidase [Arcobacter sp. CECT 8983]|uniref:prepilin peptidase n=1 Tax=Arcobacter sp. CECT 8983 TaxID=2044508 RepID=UPI00100A993F|nr:A24 family peptidase [Arcobacter sp. CECT 8983]RXJ89445.1 prepilin peptidase [Arcobacter sp. CECT 8983]
MELFSFIIGAIFGSFLNVLILRLPKSESILTRSKCPNCNEKISWYNNIPIFSFLILKAKSSCCNEKISFQYFIVEILSAFITLALFIKFGFSLELFLTSIFFYILIVLSFIDLKYKAVPDYLLILIFFVAFFIARQNFIEALKAACLLSGGFVLLNFLVTFYIQNIKARIFKDESLKTQEALGEGDIPVIASFAIVIGTLGSFVAIFFASIFAIIASLYYKYKNKEIEIPFIPFLSLGFLFEYFFEITKVIF